MSDTPYLAGDVLGEYDFNRITKNAGVDFSSNLKMALIQGSSSSEAIFLFRNTNVGAIGSGGQITEIYFDDGTLLGISSITAPNAPQYPGYKVSFSNNPNENPNPPNLPGGQSVSPAFETTAGFWADSANGSGMGVGAGEWVAITFSLINGYTAASTKAVLDIGNDLRVGLHVRSIGGQSDSFITVPNDPGGDPNVGTLPEAATLAIWSVMGLLGLCAYRWRRRR